MEMKEEVAKRSLAIMDFIGEAVKGGIDLFKQGAELAGNGIVELCQQIVTYGIVWNSFCLFLSILAIGYAIYCMVRVKKVWKEEEKSGFRDPNPFPYLFYIGSGTIAIIVGFVNLMDSARMLFLALFAPYLYIIEYVGSVVK